jgi:hypothetical protein
VSSACVHVDLTALELAKYAFYIFSLSHISGDGEDEASNTSIGDLFLCREALLSDFCELFSTAGGNYHISTATSKQYGRGSTDPS